MMQTRMFIVVYVDNSIFLSKNDDLMNTKKLLSNKFQMLDLRSFHLICLGMDTKWITR
jgi:hypothetical protein